jgi:hypothetical protein
MTSDDLLLRVYTEPPSPSNIWNFRQNNPELVVKDLGRIFGLDSEQREAVRKVLLARGVNKWLKVRRDLIAYKHQLKPQIKYIAEERAKLKQEGLYQKASALKEVQKILEKIRGDLRALCHSDRYIEWPQSTSRKTLRQINRSNS